MDIILEQCDEKDMKGVFNLIIYSNSIINDPETFIILDKVNDVIRILPYAPSFRYKIIENLSEKEAVKISNQLLGNQSFVSFIKYSAISDGIRVFGYELKPIYFPWIYGIIEPLETAYKKENNTITVFIKLNIRVEN